jgi:hypothetical protein
LRLAYGVSTTRHYVRFAGWLFGMSQIRRRLFFIFEGASPLRRYWLVANTRLPPRQDREKLIAHC